MGGRGVGASRAAQGGKYSREMMSSQLEAAECASCASCVAGPAHREATEFIQKHVGTPYRLRYDILLGITVYESRGEHNL